VEWINKDENEEDMINFIKISRGNGVLNWKIGVFQEKNREMEKIKEGMN
jgi:hypothetical protein